MVLGRIHKKGFRLDRISGVGAMVPLLYCAYVDLIGRGTRGARWKRV